MTRIFVNKRLREYWEIYPETEQYLKTWYDTAIHANWKNPSDIKNDYASASILKGGRVVFNIKGNAHRLVVKFNFERQWILSDSLEHINNMIGLMQIQFKKNT